MKKLTRQEAYSILTEGLEEPEKIQYVRHCVCVDGEYAACLGYLHDVGRKTDPFNHAYAGYLYLTERGLCDYAFICLTHSFLENDLDNVCGRPLPPGSRGYAFIKKFVEERRNTDFDRIIQICDLLCTSDGPTSLGERLADIESRKGVHPGSARHRATAEKQLRGIESRLGHPVSDFYSLL